MVVGTTNDLDVVDRTMSGSLILVDNRENPSTAIPEVPEMATRQNKCRHSDSTQGENLFVTHRSALST